LAFQSYYFIAVNNNSHYIIAETIGGISEEIVKKYNCDQRKNP